MRNPIKKIILPLSLLTLLGTPPILSTSFMRKTATGTALFLANSNGFFRTKLAQQSQHPALYIHFNKILSTDAKNYPPDIHANNLNVANQADVIENLRVQGNAYLMNNVGIGTDSPYKKLHVNGDTYISNKVGIGTNSPLERLDVNGNAVFNNWISGPKNSYLKIYGAQNDSGSTYLAIKKGKVGIGTNSPLERLDVNGNAVFNNWISGPKNSYLKIYGAQNDSGSTYLAIKKGKVGIGKTNPLEKLDVNGNAVFNNWISGPKGSSLKLYGAQDDTGSNCLAIKKGNVGIGTNTPSHPLTVQSWNKPKTSRSKYAFVAGREDNCFNYTTGTFSVYESAYFNGGIWIHDGELRVSSDTRIKTLVQASDVSEDLEKLQQITITDFRYKDQIANGNQTKKGCIAQEVEKVYPEAVRHRTQFIPDIYQMSLAIEADRQKQTAIINLEKPHGLQPGDKVKLLDDKQELIKEVQAVIDETSFEIAEWQSTEKELFVYGKEVKDFRVLDYNQIFCLNVSATQAMYQKMQASEKKVQALETRIEQLERMINLKTSS